MSLPSEPSSPLSDLVQQIEADLNHGVELCRQIRTNRHVGTSHKQLDALEESLSDGPDFVRRQRKSATIVEGGEDVAGGDGKSSLQLNSQLPM